jgi:hypothetical protein
MRTCPATGAFGSQLSWRPASHPAPSHAYWARACRESFLNSLHPPGSTPNGLAHNACIGTSIATYLLHYPVRAFIADGAFFLELGRQKWAPEKVPPGQENRALSRSANRLC